MKNRLLKNVSLSILAQAISLSTAFILNLIVPKFISEYEYAYWQLFVLYSGYVGIMHFGILDGIVLRYSQYNYDELDHKLFRSQFLVLLIVDLFCSFAIAIYSRIFLKETYLLIAFFIALSVITRNVINYSTYCLQITNRIKEYAFISIIQKVLYGIFVLFAVMAGKRDFYWICAGELLGEIIAFVWSFKYNKSIYFGSVYPLKEALAETKNNISVGVVLLLSNWSAMLSVGIIKMIVQWHWGEIIFGKVAFSFSVTNLFLNFISAISFVLFPALKRTDKDKLPQLYEKIRCAVSPLLISMLLLYYPGALLLSFWLPKYNESVVYLGTLLPIIIFQTRLSLLTNNYLKAYRKEKTLLYINLLSVFLSSAGGLILTILFDNIDIVLAYVVIVFIIISFISERSVGNIIKKEFNREYIYEYILTIIFYVCANYIKMLLGFIIYFIALLFYFALNKNQIKELINDNFEIL